MMFGRPNIIGNAELTNGWGGKGWTGSLYENGHCSGREGVATDGGFNTGLDASRSSDLYGSSTTVQPAALRVLPCIKF